MKKICFLFILFLSACATGTPTPTPAPTTAPVDPSLTSHSAPTADLSGYQPFIESFQAGADCPHLCWLGIKPGVTTATDAYNLLKASDQVKQETLQATETGITLNWVTEKTRALDSSVYLYIQDNVVKSISFDRFSPFKVQDFTNLLGDPSGVTIDMEVNGDIMYMPYSLYYAANVVKLGSEAADKGPHPNDGLVTLIMNVPYDAKYFKPWVGYGHLKEYFEGKEVHQHPANP
jgi:hypothetical protein